jgi:glutamyl-Q tRNA(Asp) synthetase
MIVSRFAPSPTGRLHLGHAYSAVLGHGRARGGGGKFLLRIEDLDQSRSRREFVDGIFEDMQWLSVDWDEPLLVQSQRSSRYAEALDRLRAQGLAYACFCTRADIAAALEAPHGPAGAHYPGTCRALADDPERRAAMPHCWRLDTVQALQLAGFPEWMEADRRFTTGPEDFDDVILARKDAPASYHLACVVDDFESGVNLVVRGADLRSSTPVQRLLQELLGMSAPAYLHHPLVTHVDGRRLAKRDLAPTLVAMRDNGIDGRELATQLLAGELPLGFAFVEA